MRFPTLIRKSSERPLIAATIEVADGGQTQSDMLVDMGSDLTLLPEHVATLLRIDLSKLSYQPVISPLGPAASYRECDIVFELRRRPDVFRWRTKVGFVARPMTYGIFGTRGFFEFFNVDYHLSEHWLDIDPVMPLPL